MFVAWYTFEMGARMTQMLVPIEAEANPQVVKLFYDMAYLQARRDAGMVISSEEADQLASLQNIMGGDPTYHRRRFRRLPIQMIVKVRIHSQEDEAQVLNMSAGGFYLSSPIEAKAGEPLQVKVEAGDGALYTFPCVVCRADCDRDACRLAVTFEGIPLEVRRGAVTDEPLSAAG